MLSQILSSEMLSQLWKVLVLFLIPVGGGIPAGVLLARSQGINWQVTMLLYLISDIILACLFEPLLLIFIRVGKKNARVAKIGAALKESVNKTTSIYGSKLGPLALVLISFGVDPMTGRSMAVAAGHGFVNGWVIAISGDMIYYSLIMISTLWLNSILGDGTWTTMIILALMMIIPALIRRFRKPKPTNIAKS